MKQNIGVIIAARMGSSRFKGKTLSNLYGKPMLGQLIERIRKSKYAQNITVATTYLDIDDEIEKYCGKLNCDVYRGEVDDVLRRLCGAAKHSGYDIVIEILGDNPLVHSDIIDTVVDLFLMGEYDYVSNLTPEYPKADNLLAQFPIGVRVQVFGLETLLKCEKMAFKDKHREHSTSLIAENPELFKTGFVTADGVFDSCEKPEWTFAVNVPKNLELINQIYASLYHVDENFKLKDVIELLSKNSEILKFMGNDAK